MEDKRQIKVGIGFATGRKSFQKVLRSYIHNWKESGLVDDKDVKLNVFVAYDLLYNKTEKKDYVNIRPDLAKHIDGAKFIGSHEISQEINDLLEHHVINANEAKMIFGKGYASQRNAVIYSAIKSGMDYLIFLDDDEYPVAVTKTRKTAVWGGQHVLSTHLKNIEEADYTHGHHCGYISPIPYIEYNDAMSETDFRSFIEAISNDILSWEKVKKVMNSRGVTYADPAVIISETTEEVPEINHAKFISGANLGINLKNPGSIFPFYNPPGARGEDTFLSTCLSDKKVLKVPCYTFHDGFSSYNNLLEGALPIVLKFMKADNKKISDRFYKACLGWIRYKPLLLYITQMEQYEEKIADMRHKLEAVLPKICAYFGTDDFMKILPELEKYHKNVRKHHADFKETQRIWGKLMAYLAKSRTQ